MKKTLFSLSLIALFAFIWTNCTKTTDEIQSNDVVTQSNIKATSRSENIALTSPRVHFESDMLNFEDRDAFDEIANALEHLASDESFKQQFIASKGAGADDPESENYVEYAAFQAFEERFPSFISMRRKNQTASFNGTPEDELDNAVNSTALQTLLNWKRRIRIGSIIFQEVDQFHTLICFGNTPTVLDGIPDPFTPNLPPSVCMFDNRIEEDEERLRGLLLGECHLVALSYPISPNKFKLEAILTNGKGTTFPFTGTTILWEVHDATGALKFQTTSSSSTVNTPTFTANTKYPLTVTAKILSGGNCADVKTATTEISSATPDCSFTPKFSESAPGNYIFSLASFPSCCNLTCNWSFNVNGTITNMNGVPVGNTVPFNSGTCIASVCNFTVTVTLVNPGGCTATRTMTINRSCGTSSITNRELPFLYNSGSQKTISKLWIDNKLIWSHFGANQKSYKKRVGFFGVVHWDRENVTELSLQFSLGDRFIKDCNFENLNTNLFASPNWDVVEYSYDLKHNRVGVRPGEATCRYSLINNGLTFPNHTTLRF
jgi:hypothetical protein